MSPEEKVLLEKSIKISEENNRILLRMQKVAHFGLIWGIIKAVIIIVPLVVGFFFLQPYLDEAMENFNGFRDLLNIQ